MGLTSMTGCARIACMSRNVNLDDEAVAALKAHRQGNESFSRVVKRLAPPPIKTFGDLERFLDQLEGPLFSDLEMLKRLRQRRAGGTSIAGWDRGFFGVEMRLILRITQCP